MFGFFFNHTPTTEIYTLSLHDALPICVNITYKSSVGDAQEEVELPLKMLFIGDYTGRADDTPLRSEEHTSELQSRPHLVCRLLLEKKKRTSSWLSVNVRFLNANMTPPR